MPRLHEAVAVLTAVADADHAVGGYRRSHVPVVEPALPAILANDAAEMLLLLMGATPISYLLLPAAFVSAFDCSAGC